MENIKIEKITNCITLITEELAETKSFTLGFWFPHGSRFENKSENGISHFIEHLLFKGTNKRTAKKISDEIEKTGGYLNAFTTKEETCFYGRGIVGSEEKHFRVLSDMILNSTFPEKEIKRESGVVIDELNDIEDTPDEIIFDDFENLLYGNKGLGNPIIGTEKNILSFSREKIIDYYQKKYLNNEFYIVSSGNIKHDILKKLVEKYFQNSNCKNKLNKIKTVISKPEYLKNTTHASNQSYAILGMSSVGVKDENYFKLRLLSIILGEGSSSRLFNAVREKKGIAYQINTFVNSYEDVSSFGVFFSTNSKNFEQAKKIILNEKKKLLEKGISNEEFVRAKNIFVGNTILALEETSNRMVRLAKLYGRYGKIISIDGLIETVNEISKLELNSFIQKVLNTDWVEVNRIPN